MIAPGVMPNWGAASVTEIQVTSAYPNDARGFFYTYPKGLDCHRR
jgi:hypothetical protein